MKKFLTCVKGESSSNDDFDERLFNDYEQLNNAWLNRQIQPPQALNAQSRALSRYGAKFQWREIFYGTSNFHNDNYLGQGNFGRVYRCDFPRINTVGAVKIQNLQSPEAFSEFTAEIKTLHAADHPNVVNLLGKCLDGEHCAIVYEFMPRGSLERYFYADPNPPPGLQQDYPVLDWHRRLGIAIGVASALVYLHEQLRTVHRDLKLANVLLDEGFVPKLTDFGLATRMVGDKDGTEWQSEIREIKGTRGCIAPETEEFGFVSSKSDVYSYGVFLLTLFTGMKAFDNGKPNGEKNLAERMRRVWQREDYIRQAVDVSLGNNFSVEGLEILFQVAKKCTESYIFSRPTMRVVERMVREVAGFEVPETTRHSI